jgi:hypothetical protein
MTIEVRTFSYDDNSGKEAVIVKEETGYLRNKGYYVHIKDRDGKVIKVIDVTEHSLRYASDCAYNYSTGLVQ